MHLPQPGANGAPPGGAESTWLPHLVLILTELLECFHHGAAFTAEAMDFYAAQIREAERHD